MVLLVLAVGMPLLQLFVLFLRESFVVNLLFDALFGPMNGQAGFAEGTAGMQRICEMGNVGGVLELLGESEEEVPLAHNLIVTVDGPRTLWWFNILAE